MLYWALVFFIVLFIVSLLMGGVRRPLP